MGTKAIINNNTYDDLIVLASWENGINANLIKAVISVESAFNPKAVSRAGAQGLMQLMPQTAKRFGVENVFEPKDNIKGGTKYLQFLMLRYKGNLDLTLAAYNAGEGAVDKYDGIPPYQETQDYVRKVKAKLTALNRI